MLEIFTKSYCGKCDDIKKRLKDKGVDFVEKSSEKPEILDELITLVNKAGLKNPVLPVIRFEDGTLISNDLGLYKELRERAIL